jgi:hypothetical protein
MPFGRRFDCGVLVCAVALSRILFRSRFLYDIDSVNYALALDRFDPVVHQPHPPGYFLYVYLGRLARFFTHDANLALVTLSIAASCVAVVLIYSLADSWFGRRAAIWAGLIFLFSPLCWFHGTVALTYIVEAAFSSAVGYLCWRSFLGETRFIVPSAILLGIAAGCRQSSLLFLGPLWLLSLRTATKKQIGAGLLALGVTLVAWIAPMLRESGGTEKYFSSLLLLWRIAPARDTVFNSSLFMSLARLCTILGVVGLCFGSAALWFLRPRLQGVGMRSDADKKLFTWVWIGPGFLFFTFIFLKYVNSGYLLILSPPIFAWLGARVSDWYATAGGQARKASMVAALAIGNVMIFLYAPVYCSYKSVREAEAELVNIRDGLPKVADASDTVIVGFDSHFFGYRHPGYYLPRFLTIQFPEISYPDGKRAFAVEGRNTRLLSALPADSIKKFVFFPLPAGQAYNRHLEEVRKRFPAGTLKSTIVDGREYFTGSSADLTFLFPGLTPPVVYTHSYSPKERCKR